jgi:hypothetical protein
MAVIISEGGCLWKSQQQYHTEIQPKKLLSESVTNQNLSMQTSSTKKYRVYTCKFHNQQMQQWPTARIFMQHEHKAAWVMKEKKCTGKLFLHDNTYNLHSWRFISNYSQSLNFSAAVWHLPRLFSNVCTINQFRLNRDLVAIEPQLIYITSPTRECKMYNPRGKNLQYRLVHGVCYPPWASQQ